MNPYLVFCVLNLLLFDMLQALRFNAAVKTKRFPQTVLSSTLTEDQIMMERNCLHNGY